ncbi:Transport protein particle (TRAPP) component Bet3-like protein A [Monocercomonoides exilis]|uniref:Transport protein particle (TRAPP) component Bet3-like protein A n=1 Tax=Monocercomonoides exilis TaxID=2049356 RepID=UPI00355A78FE|nr:Transport protein particle (TRAPP) component Bet3-like protein A [Monocercomonoides exilis]|eukprot:MONOS_4269.1-p1 / transcript=MONOS_4269.1 / gene=MONOS_4269 / organism=Monocercomonoides_exilis_PA203 / gene_product= Transport protein particle (TRAPP) component Bet3 paralogue A / transcript_product= Transport protein particle (TRAPP) component Bet3 paralogue A / location=Mono_scaffold00111:71351-72035(+) / protein_length=187 / sequence_SO=supercontig / SO=protein_coding / is_pseudo=false
MSIISSSSSNDGDSLWHSMPKVNAELFSMTYGAIVAQILKDYEEPEEVNGMLFRMGQFIGRRLVDEFFAKSKIPTCGSIRETADNIAKIGFKMFLGIQAQTTFPGPENVFHIIFKDNPMTEFVELPEKLQSISYCNVLCGVIQGALEMVHITSACTFVQDQLKGNEVNEMRVEIRGTLKEGSGAGE